MDIQSVHMKQLFADDPFRAERFSLELPEIFLDYSKNRLTQAIFDQLIQLAKEVDLETWRADMFSGKAINKTENRAVLHTALRNRAQRLLILGGQNITEQVEAQLARMQAFTEKVRSGEWLGCTGKPITDIVSIGVGGSNLGPQMVTDALVCFDEGSLPVHYVSNVDGLQIDQTLKRLNPETTLFVISSKTFTTMETMTNAKTAMRWWTSQTDSDEPGKHFAAVSSNRQNAVDFGIHEENIFDMWDWVGGRFSLWSAIGLPVALHLGFDIFIELLEGAHAMDEHFRVQPLEENGPVILALLSVWNTSFLHAQSQAILPYEQCLHMLPAYLQQAEMESNGKSVNMDGEEIDYTTVPGIWGGPGINGQHAFYQYLHQSNTPVPADFIGAIHSNTDIPNHHQKLMPNFFAQTKALMTGVTEQEVRQELNARSQSEDYIERTALHKVHKGNKPTNSLLLDRVTPRSLGALIALYEHKIFCQGIILGICSFDQWGVELGKGLAADIEKQLDSGNISDHHDSSTQNLMSRYLKSRPWGDSE